MEEEAGVVGGEEGLERVERKEAWTGVFQKRKEVKVCEVW